MEFALFHHSKSLLECFVLACELVVVLLEFLHFEQSFLQRVLRDSAMCTRSAAT